VKNGRVTHQNFHKRLTVHYDLLVTLILPKTSFMKKMMLVLCVAVSTTMQVTAQNNSWKRSAIGKSRKGNAGSNKKQ